MTIALSALLVGCGRPAPCTPAATNGAPSPFAVVADADKLAARHEYAEALPRYLWALDWGRQVEPAFVDDWGSLLDSMVRLATDFPPAKHALDERCEKLKQRILDASEGRGKVSAEELVLFVRLATRIGRESSALKAYGIVKTRLPADARLRWQLWVPIEAHLVEQRRYQDTAPEADVGLAAIKYYLGVLRAVTVEDESANPILRVATQHTVKSEGGVHFEAMLGASKPDAAWKLADELIEFRPTAQTFAVLIEHARRAGSQDVATRLQAKAYEIVPPTDRTIVDEAMRTQF